MNILWNPETGRCAKCSKKSKSVRRFTYDNKHMILCYECWASLHDDTIIDSKKWIDNTTYMFNVNQHKHQLN